MKNSKEMIAEVLHMRNKEIQKLINWISVGLGVIVILAISASMYLGTWSMMMYYAMWMPIVTFLAGLVFGVKVMDKILAMKPTGFEASGLEDTVSEEEIFDEEVTTD